MWLQEEAERCKQEHPWRWKWEGLKLEFGEWKYGINMKDIIKLLTLLIPVIKDLVNSADSEISTGKKKRILKIMEDQDLTKLEKLERIIFRKGKTKVEIMGFIRDGKLITMEYIERGVVVNKRLIEHYYHLASRKTTKR